MKKFIALTLGLALFGTASADWPLFHKSPDFSGYTGDSLVLPMKKIFWAKLGGRITASPVIRGDTLYVGSQSGVFYALNTQTGRKIWAWKTGAAFKASAAVVEDLVVAANMDGVVYGFRKNGDTAWTVKAGGPVSGAVNYASDKGSIYVTSWDGRLYALDTAGKVKWSFYTNAYADRPEIYWGAPYLNGCVFVPHNDSRLYCLEDTGSGYTQKWLAHHSTVLYDMPISSQPVIINGKIYYGRAWSERRYIYNATDAATGTYSSPAQAHTVAPAAGHATTWYYPPSYTGVGPNLYRFDTLKSLRYAAIKRALSGPVVTRKHIVCQNEDGVFFVLHPDSTKILYSDTFVVDRSLPDGFRGSRSAAAVDRGRIYFGGDDGYLYCYDNASTAVIGLVDDSLPFMDMETAGPAAPFELTSSPNPANPALTIAYAIPAALSGKPLSLAVYGVNGRLIRELISAQSVKGRSALVFNGRGLSAGVYILRLTAGDRSKSLKFVLAR